MRRSRDPATRPTTRTAAATLALALSAALLPACAGPDPAESRLKVDRGEFIEVMVAIRDATLELERQDSVPEGRFEELRDSILAAHEVDRAELYAFVNAHPDLEYQEELWDSINRRLMRPLKAPDVTAGDSLADSVGTLPQRPKRGDAMERMRPDRTRPDQR